MLGEDPVARIREHGRERRHGVSRQTKAALAAIVGLLAGLGVLAGVVISLRDHDGASSTLPAGTSASVETGASGTTSTPPQPITTTIATGGFPNALAVSSRGVWVVRDGRKVVRIALSGRRILDRTDVGDELGSERPCGIAVGQGSVWIVTVSGQVAQVDLQTRVVRRLIDTGGATCVAVGGGAVWVTNSDANKVVRVDPVSASLSEIPLGGFPEGVAYGFHSVWVAASDPPDGANGAVSRIDPTTNQVVKTILVPNLPEFVAAGSGMVWTTSNNGTIVEIDPKTNQNVASIRITNGGRTTVAAGGGRAWAAELQTRGETGRVYEIDPNSGNVRALPATLPVVSPLGMAFGAGALWIADYKAGNVIRYQPAPG